MKNDCPDKRIGFFAERCRGAGVEVSVQSASIGIVRAVRHYLSEKNSVHMLSCLLLGIIKGVIPYFNDSFCIWHVTQIVNDVWFSRKLNVRKTIGKCEGKTRKMWEAAKK